MFKYLSFLLVLLIACSGNNGWEGTWQAEWSTDPSGYPEIQGITDFTMPGEVTFRGDSITIEGYGFKGCIFNSDTISHSLTWEVRNDSLLLYNEESMPGIIYSIVDSDNERIQLQLEDIFLTLTRS